MAMHEATRGLPCSHGWFHVRASTCCALVYSASCAWRAHSSCHPCFTAFVRLRRRSQPPTTAAVTTTTMSWTAWGCPGPARRQPPAAVRRARVAAWLWCDARACVAACVLASGCGPSSGTAWNLSILSVGARSRVRARTTPPQGLTRCIYARLQYDLRAAQGP